MTSLENPLRAWSQAWAGFIERPPIKSKFLENKDKFGLEYAQGYRMAQYDASGLPPKPEAPAFD